MDNHPCTYCVHVHTDPRDDPCAVCCRNQDVDDEYEQAEMPDHYCNGECEQSGVLKLEGEDG